MDSNNEEYAELKLVTEVRILRRKLRARDEEVTALQDQVVAVTTHLHETSNELECRMAFVTEAMAQIESLEAHVAETKRGILEREMQLHDSEQRVKMLEAALQEKETQCEQKENEFRRVERELSQQKSTERQLHRELQVKSDELSGWKAKLHGITMSVDELELQNEHFRKGEGELVLTLRQQVEAAETREQSWKSRLAKHKLKVESLEKQCHDHQEELERVERERVQENEEHERDKLIVAEQQSDKQKHSILQYEKVKRLSKAVEKARVKEQLFRREIFRLRKELLRSESKRETEQRRQAQLVEGKEKEVAFIWQKYVEMMPLTDENN